MPTLLQKVRSGMRAGTALWLAGAGCSDSITRPEPATDAAQDAQAMRLDGGNDAAPGVDASRDANTHVVDAGGDSSSTLQPYLLSALDCIGRDGGTWCCQRASCSVFEGACPAADALPPDLATGSPECDITGPFAPNPEDLNAAPGNCCYIIGYVAIDGRPLLVEESLLVAAIVIRADWTLG